ncbi:hypothetical protein ONR75_19385 [Rhodopseudomonas sp. P2A-2r]|uniref:DUF6894 family protein n=1 Tax=Rhodopseudomonas sp. P2A-2r TaxID=2991972 RepID=UPI0022344ECC|nr:hypothetical protein [Rhodopseudomonas sp. P2A-2r]UZE47147.1 hypothetical protein ONR75_19385 [Rhodopseudomonas sp. P2A-2r]
MKRTYFFDLKDGVAVRDRLGLEFITSDAAIAHSREIALKLSEADPPGDPNLHVSVINEVGAEIHREPVYPDVVDISESKNG